MPLASKNKKYLIVIDLVLILGSLLSIFFIVGYTQPLAIAPLNDGKNSGSSLIFNFSDADYLVVDDNLRFESPKTLFIDEEMSLAKGRHYIKSVYGLYSEVREINTEIDIIIQIRKMPDGSVGVFNVGDSDLEVETYEVGYLTDSHLVSSGVNDE